MCGNPEMTVTICGMPRARYNELFDGVVDSATFGELTAEEVTQGWHFCGSFDGLLLHPESEEEYACCRCNGSITRAFAKSCRMAVNRRKLNEIDERRSEIHRILLTVDDELLGKDAESMGRELDALDIRHEELSRDVRSEEEV